MILVNNQSIHDPRINLALEEFVLRNRKEGNYLILYINEPSVIIGKHQNVLEEVDSRFVEEQDIPVIRRISGGGAVYHDRGNLNFSLITDYTPDRHNNYRPFLVPIISALREVGVEARLNNRNSLVLNDGRKFSGNAQFATRGRMLSHGTLLFDADLEALSTALLPDSFSLESRAVQSIRSRVVNISSVLDLPLSIEEFQRHIMQGLVPDKPDVEELSEKEWEQVKKLASTKYDSWEWNVGRSPQYTVVYETAEGMVLRLSIKDGIVVRVESEEEEESVARLANELCGQKFRSELIKRKSSLH